MMECFCQKMMDQAEDDLQQLESQHPHRFNYLKLELRSFILLLQSQHSLLHRQSPPSPSSSPVATQASTSGRKRNGDGNSRHEDEEVMDDDDDSTVKGGEDRVGVVLKRAKCCLRKLQEFKATLIS
ncbi:hypothetical protein MLD38_008189 [Melastoma candidum]|uniref:Uncharacterized protein n=1 Tax=Melastoma candidum TaxID=119954 RepID=A0ACB9RTP6_9MYRT|nr:hypothetical protein MLD38_008189 [Melastoma candidum]